MKERKYSLFTAICMVTGIVIGSGIFFKVDDILLYTNGNMLLGILIFIIASIAIVFGSLTISQLAMRTDSPGGIIAYTEEFVNRHMACAFGWFQMFIYLPTLVAIVSWVSGIYICQLFSIRSSLEIQTGIGLLVSIALFGMNMLSAKMGGYFQNASMIIKLIPLILLAVLGIIFGNPGEIAVNDLTHLGSSAGTLTWITAFAPIAFSFDGWIVATTLSHEIKNSKRNLPLALMISPMIILFAYVAYFIGITSLLGVDSVLKNGDSSVYLAADQLFGSFSAKIVLVFIVISVLGTVNGIILSYIRLPYTLAFRKMLPCRKMICNADDDKVSYSVSSGLIAFGITAIWTVINYLTQKFELPGDISEIAICVSYLNYIVLYVTVLKMTKQKKIKGLWKGILNPVFAIIGSVIIFSGTISNPIFEIAMIVCYGVMVLAYFYSKRTLR